MKNKVSPSFIIPKEFFENTQIPGDDEICFVLMPFGKNFDEIYNRIIVETVEKDLKMKCFRADSIYDPKPIMTTILEMIQKAGIIIADLTDRNPNVFYELGIAHSRKDKIIIITQKPEDVPFDIKHLRYIVYENSIAGGEDLRLSLTKTIKMLKIGKERGIEQNDKEEETPRITSLESIIEKSVETHGAYMAELDDEASEKAENMCEEFRKKVLVPIVKMYGLKNIEIDKRKNRATFEDGYILSEYSRKGGEFDMVSYQVKHHVKTSPPNLGLFDKVAELFGIYDKLVFEMEDNINIEEIFQQATDAGINILSIDANEITFNLISRKKCTIRMEDNIVKLIIECGYGVSKDLHRKLSPKVILNYLNGKIGIDKIKKIFGDLK